MIALIFYLLIGKVRTSAKWIRDFVQEHPGYKKNSVVTEEINYDLIKVSSDIAEGRISRVHLKTVNIVNGTHDQF